MDNKKLKILGELISNKTSLDIISILSQEELYTNEIASRLDIRVSLVIHHLNKLKALGLLSITEKPISKRLNNHKFFKMNQNLIEDIKKLLTPDS